MMAGAVGPRPAPTLRLLCLHGRGTDGAGLERAMEEAQQQANLPSVAFEFLDAPYASGAPPSAPLDDAPAGASARCWWRERWNGDLGRVDYEGAERSVAAASRATWTIVSSAVSCTPGCCRAAPPRRKNVEPLESGHRWRSHS